MTDTINFKPLQVISIKDIAYIMCISHRTASQIYGDIKRDNELKRVTYSHLMTYLKV